MAYALASRAMLRAGQNNPAAAWDDLLALHRLSRLESQSPSATERLTAIAIEAVATTTAGALVNSPAMTAPLAETMQKDLQALAPHRRMSDAHEFERFMHLDAVQTLQRPRFDQWFDVEDVYHGTPPSAVRWNVVAERFHEWFDEWQKAADIPNPVERRRALLVLRDRLEKLKTKINEPDRLAALGGGGPREIALKIADRLIVQNTPDIRDESNMRAEARILILQTQLALKRWQLARGSTPAVLSDLVPEFLPSKPTDPFSDLSLVYVRRAGKLWIYTVGENGVDDGGIYDPKSNKDDIAGTLSDQ